MAGRGPQPTPTAVLAARGSDRASTRPHEPAVPAAIPKRPYWLKGTSLAAWNYLAPMLAAAGILTELDQHQLALFCDTWARWMRVRAFLERKGESCEVITGQGSREQLRPEAALAVSLLAEMRSQGDRLGLSPAARTRLQVVAAPAASSKPRPWAVVPGGAAPPPPTAARG